MKTKAATYNKLVKFASARGSIGLIGNIIGSFSDEAIKGYLERMRKDDPALYKSWGSKWKPGTDEDDPMAGGTDEEEEDPMAGGTDEEEEDPMAEQETVAAQSLQQFKLGVEKLQKVAKSGKMPIVEETPLPVATGKTYADKFRLQDANGLLTDLEVFSKHPLHGYILRVPVPTDMRTVRVKGKDITVDLMRLRRDPDGMTEGVANSKLIAAAELA